jgi:hypothetical protein
VSTDDRNHGAELGLKGEGEPILVELKTLKEHGLTGARLVRIFEREMCPWAISKYFGD